MDSTTPSPFKASRMALLWTALRLTRSKGRAKEAFKREPLFKEDGGKSAKMFNGWWDSLTTIGAVVLFSVFCAFVLAFVMVLISFSGATVFPWAGAAWDDRQCAHGASCEPIEVVAVSRGALTEDEWSEAIKGNVNLSVQSLGETLKKSSGPLFILDSARAADVSKALALADERARRAGAEKTDAAVAASFIRQLAKGLSVQDASVAALKNDAVASLEPTPYAKARWAILAGSKARSASAQTRHWVTPARMWSRAAPSDPKAWALETHVEARSEKTGTLVVLSFLSLFFLLVFTIWLLRDTVVEWLDAHRPGLEKAADVFAIESSAASAEPGPERGRL
jgi:hypothetical protein